MKKSGSKLETILAKAEKYLNRGNYAFALKEFNKAYKKSKDTDIAAKIEYCRQENQKAKAKDLIKRARKYLKKDKKQPACRCFEEAYEITGEKWIAERISELTEAVACNDTEADARDYESRGAYLKAAELYQESHNLNAGSGGSQLKIRQAVCLVKDGQHQQATACFEEISVEALESSSEALYHYGFALMRQGRYFRCLQVWEPITSTDASFVAQKETAARLLEADIYGLLLASGASSLPATDQKSLQNQDRVQPSQDRATTRIDYSSDLTAAYEATCYLREHFGFEGLDALKTYGQWRLIESLWREEQYETIADLIFKSDVRDRSAALIDAWGPTILANLARLSFKCAETSGRQLNELALYWLTALHHPSTWKALSLRHGNAPEFDNQTQVRHKLIDMADALIRSHAGSGGQEANEAKAFWDVEKQLIADLEALVGGREDRVHLVCTPRFARHFGVSDQVLNLIADAKSGHDWQYFKNQEHYLETGSYYSNAGPSLYYLKAEAYKKALDHLPETSQNKFDAYGILKVRYSYGLYCLETGAEMPGRYFDVAPELFAIAPHYAADLVKNAEDADELDDMNRYEDALNGVYTQTQKDKSEPLVEIEKALSYVMSRRALEMFNKNLMNNKTLATTLQKALKLHPDNDFAHGLLEETKADLEILEMEKALNRFKMHKACKIAVESQYARVTEAFFEYMEYGLRGVRESSHDDAHKLLLLNETYDWCAWVDETHPILDQIEDLIHEFGGEVPR